LLSVGMQCKKLGILYNEKPPGPDYIKYLYTSHCANKRRSVKKAKSDDFKHRFNLKVCIIFQK
jgi:hypothetical protein